MNSPAFDPDDPRLTAYALGESSAAEREAVERLLAASPEARAEVERTAAVARDLEAEYHRENEAYWDDRPTSPAPGKVIEFPAARRTGWMPTVAAAWKIAAVLVAVAALVPLFIRRAPLAQTVALASPRPTEPTPPSPATVPPVEAMPAAASVAQASVPADAAARGPDASPEARDTDALIAMVDADRTGRDDTAARASSQQAVRSLDNVEAKPATRRSMAAVAPPAMSAPGAPAGATGGGTISLVDRIGRSLVRIRAGDGSFVGGVAVTAEGRILAARPLPAGEKRPTVVLADGREVLAEMIRDGSGSGLSPLQVEGMNLPAVTLATRAPADKAALTVVSTDQHTGATRYLRARAMVSRADVRLQWADRPPTSDETSFVFDLDGGLLNTAAARPAAKGETRSKSASGPVIPGEFFLRPFSAVERTLLQPTAQTPSR